MKELVPSSSTPVVSIRISFSLDDLMMLVRVSWVPFDEDDCINGGEPGRRGMRGN